MAESTRIVPVSAAADVQAAIDAWRMWLRAERRASSHTLAAYERDLFQFFHFLAEHLGGAPSLADLRRLRTADFRAWLAACHGRGLARASVARALSVVRGFFRWLAREELVVNPALASLRTPRVPHSVPKAISAEEAIDVVDTVAELARQDWIGKRDTAVSVPLPTRRDENGVLDLVDPLSAPPFELLARPHPMAGKPVVLGLG